MSNTEHISVIRLIARVTDLALIILFAILGIVALFKGATQTGIMWLMLSELWVIAIAINNSLDRKKV